MVTTVAISRDAAQVAVLLNSPEIGRAVRPGRGRQGDVRPTGGAPEQGWVSSACGSATVGPAMEVAAPWS